VRQQAAHEFVRALKKAGYAESRQSASHLILKHRTRPAAIVPVHAHGLNRGAMLRIIRQGGFPKSPFLFFLR
jgi:predicted RNA binding protein YcfA (HicA-like mRNA interferase family)